MKTAYSIAQYPWPLALGAALGLVLCVGIRYRALRARGAMGVVALVATGLTGAAAGAFVGLAWLWAIPMSRSVSCLYTCTEMQFLSNEQFRQIMVITDLAWILPIATLFFGAVAVLTGRRTS